MAVSILTASTAVEQDGEPLQEGDHLFRVEHARRDEELTGSGRSEGGIGLDERFDVFVVVVVALIVAVGDRTWGWSPGFGRRAGGVVVAVMAIGRIAMSGIGIGRAGLEVRLIIGDARGVIDDGCELLDAGVGVTRRCASHRSDRCGGGGIGVHCCRGRAAGSATAGRLSSRRGGLRSHDSSCSRRSKLPFGGCLRKHYPNVGRPVNWS